MSEPAGADLGRSTRWRREARLRLEDARLLRERGRYARVIATAYYAVHAAGKGLLLARGVRIHSHGGLTSQLSLHVVRAGDLPQETAAVIDDLYKDRLDADYDLAFFDAEQAREALSVADRYVRLMEACT